jgi:tetratricopeptide (TPR) repeat protein
MRRLLVIIAFGLMLATGVRTAQAAQQPPLEVPADANGDGAALAALTARRLTEIDTAIHSRDWERAEVLLVAEIERTPDPADLLKRLAGVFMNDRKPLNAAIAIKKAEKFRPLDAGTRFQLALAYVAMRRGDWARPELERLAAAEPLNTLYAYWLGRLDYDSGRYDAAIARLRRVVEREPSFVRAYDNLGLCYDALNQPEEAVQQYREAIRRTRETGEKWPWPFLNLGVLLKQRGEMQDAEALFREALEADPAFAPALYHLGTVLEQTGRSGDAVQMLLRAVAADASYAEPHFALSRIYRREGRTAEADAALERFRKLHEPTRGPTP